MTTDSLAPIHPGEILREEFLAPLGMTPYALAKACHVPRTRFERLVHERAPVTPDTALRLGRYFGTSPEFWLAIQSRYDVETAQRSIGEEIASIQPHEKLAAEG
jgi:addiction module HigA family antidote